MRSTLPPYISLASSAQSEIAAVAHPTIAFTTAAPVETTVSSSLFVTAESVDAPLILVSYSEIGASLEGTSFYGPYESSEKEVTLIGSLISGNI